MRLGDVIQVNPESIRAGYPHEEIEYIDISSVGNGTREGTKSIALDGAPSRAKRIVRNADTLLATVRPNLRSFLYVKQPSANTVASTGFAVLRATEAIDARFLYYTVTNQPFTDYLTANAKGAAYPAVDTDTIERVEIYLPDLSAQKRISTILSAYDDLIENNLQRIKILEEIAQNLYREWFVKFRFPGHEHVRMVDSPLGKIPEGWEATILGQHLANLESGKRPRGGVGDLASGVASVGAENVVSIGVHNYQNEKFVSSEFFISLRRGIVKDKDVALYKDGAYIGRATYFRDGFPHTDFCVNEHVFLLRSTGDQLSQNALYLWLKERSTISAIRATNANAAQPGINQKGVKGLEIVTPSREIVSQFDEIIDPYLALIISLAKRNNVLRQTRDLLLPKLISGELDVSGLNIDIREAV